MGHYPLPAYHYQVEWGGTRLGFTEVSGLNIHYDVNVYREGNSPQYNFQKMPGLVRFTNIVLKRGIVKGDNEFFDWMKTAQLNTIERRDITISLLNEKHEPVVVWKVQMAFPIRYSGPVLHAGDTCIAMEELELAHEGIVVQMI